MPSQTPSRLGVHFRLNSRECCLCIWCYASVSHTQSVLTSSREFLRCTYSGLHAFSTMLASHRFIGTWKEGGDGAGSAAAAGMHRLSTVLSTRYIAWCTKLDDFWPSSYSWLPRSLAYRHAATCWQNSARTLSLPSEPPSARGPRNRIASQAL